MKYFAIFLLFVLCPPEWVCCAEKKRLQATVATGAAILGIISQLAGNTQITVDANKLFDQVSATLKTGAQKGCMVINLDSAGKDHTFYGMPDVMNMGGHINNPIRCAFGTQCVVYKLALPGASGKIKVGVDGASGAGAFVGNFFYLDEGYVYHWTGKGFLITGNMANWRAALDKRRRLFRPKH
jgi:hypothetical protein